MGGGAWPFLVGGLPCQVDSGNERDLSLLTSHDCMIAIIHLQRGMPSKRESSARVDYVPALCTHRPSLLPIGCAGEAFGLAAVRGSPLAAAEKFVNLRKDHCIDQTQTANQRIPAGGPARAACAPVPDRRPGSRGPVRSGGLGRPLPFTGKDRTRSAKPPIKSTTRNILKILTAALCGRRQPKTTLNNGYLGSRIDEERSEMRYVVLRPRVCLPQRRLYPHPPNRGRGPGSPGRQRPGPLKTRGSSKDPHGKTSREVFSAAGRAQVPWKGASERVRTPSATVLAAPRGAFAESGCLGMQPKAGGKSHLRLNTDGRPIANKYREGKMKRTLKRELKSA
ncbi:hypothetical protein COCSUDRAFT_19213 [Coccomyxa subellipsoidea C-169]|uniref:Uncharacterized protein n=1 Tax=Coccomyxa subellipsoidea (strain C-169) TaxID=574566 RepID=I0YN42_COCSC|nr:hypothetical protein COCSUDRAFT_19213 [Coccomyxa subellipsoidea C-169]EIE19811.1 hypothetical protein COCSUDRAFT_19213 [Coccomyxa subellipsoidea C-169]|eukprot:XP_005644355.1 hypothetical protein COCSUDRAFT_19213 [Coccomyxa subellipsoidea C-169]